MRAVFLVVAVLTIGAFAEEPEQVEEKAAEPATVEEQAPRHTEKKKSIPGKGAEEYAEKVVESMGAYQREVYESDIVQDYVAVPSANLKKAMTESKDAFNGDPYVKQAKQDMTTFTDKAKDKIRRFVQSVGDITKTAEAELSLAQTDAKPQPAQLLATGTVEKNMETVKSSADSEMSAQLNIALAATAAAGLEEMADAKEGRKRTLSAAKQLLKLMNVAAMADERAHELLEEARKADAEADLVRMPVRDFTDKKSRYQRAKTLHNAQSLNVQAAQAVVKARKLAGMVKELKESAKSKTA